jgi:hypothetical protein
MVSIRISFFISVILLLFSCAEKPAIPILVSKTVAEHSAELERVTSGPMQLAFSSTSDLAKLAGVTPLVGVPSKIETGGRLLLGRSDGLRQEVMGVFQIQSHQPSVGLTTIDMKLVADLETFWVDQSIQPSGVHQVMKFSWSGIESAPALSQQVRAMNPMDQIRQFLDEALFEKVESKNGMDVLRARIDADEFSRSTGQPLPPGILALALELHLDQKTSLPYQFSVGTDSGIFMTMSFSDIRSIPVGQVLQANFQYLPPPGVPVMEMDKLGGAPAPRR